MDAILGAALDELDDDDDDDENDDSSAEKHSPVSQHNTFQGSGPATIKEDTVVLEEELGQLDGMMKEILSATDGAETNEAFGAVMAKLQQQMANEMEAMEKEDPVQERKPPQKAKQKDIKDKKKVSDSKPASKPRPVFGPEPPPAESDVDRTISKLLNDMASASIEEPAVDHDGMDDMMKELEKLGGEDMIDGMMQQMLAKDLMYEPMKEVATKFPAWLKDNQSLIPEEEYAR